MKSLSDTPPTPKKNQQNWLTYIAISVLWCIAQLPLSWLLTLGYWVGTLMYHLLKRRTNITRCNIQACFPTLDTRAQEQLTRECIIENVRGLFESAKAWWGNTQSIVDSAEVHGLDIIQKASASGQGCLLIGAHFTTLDMAARVMAEVWPLTILYRPFNDPLFDKVVLKARQGFHPNVINKNRMRELVRSVQKGQTLWYPADQDYGAKDSVFAPFFDLQAATLATTAGLARVCKGHVVGLYHHRLADNRYRLEFIAMPDFATQDPQAAATQANLMLETGIRQYPEQYMWVHRRFKTRPDNEPAFYPR